MKIEQGAISDLVMILDTVAECVSDLREKGIFQWDEHYPTVDILRADIFKGNLHMVKEGGRCAAIVVLDEYQDGEWKAVDWSRETSRPLMLHRLVVHPLFQRKGMGRTLIDFAMEYAVRNGYDHIRFDVYSGNPRLMATYERMGCVRRGEVKFPFRELPFYCYEKVLP